MKSEIRFINDYDPCVYELWQEAFGDSEEEISFFLENCKNYKLLGCYCDGKLASMLFLVDCKVNSVDCKYIYAACTLEKYKKQGLMTDLLIKCREKYRHIALIPANENLVNFYKNRGFLTPMDLNYLVFEQSDEIKEYLTSGCSLNEPYLLYYSRGEI